MILAVIFAFCLGFTPIESNQELAPEAVSRDVSAEITSLLELLAPTLTNKVWVGPPDPDKIRKVRAALVKIAGQSPESRKKVIDVLVKVLNDPKGEFDFNEVVRWRTAVELLGDLNAIESIEDLVKNIKWTSYNGSPHPTPPVRAALVRIGEPAVPRLLGSLFDANELTRLEASEALGSIGESSFSGLLKVLASSSPVARASAAHSIALIGGARAREAIEIAVHLETNEKTRARLEDAIKYMNHVECLRDSTKRR